MWLSWIFNFSSRLLVDHKTQSMAQKFAQSIPNYFQAKWSFVGLKLKRQNKILHSLKNAYLASSLHLIFTLGPILNIKHNYDVLCKCSRTKRSRLREQYFWLMPLAVIWRLEEYKNLTSIQLQNCSTHAFNCTIHHCAFSIRSRIRSNGYCLCRVTDAPDPGC